MADVSRRRPKVFHVGGHKAGLCLSGWEGEVVGYADEGADGAKVSANLPIKVRFQRDQGGGGSRSTSSLTCGPVSSAPWRTGRHNVCGKCTGV